MSAQQQARVGAWVAGALVSCVAFLLPDTASAVSYVKSVEYVEIDMASGVTIGSANLTKGQSVANCVPFASAMVSGTDGNYQRVFTDLYFQTGPDRVTAERSVGTGTVSVGVFVVEFDPAFVIVRQGAFGIAAGLASATVAIPSVALTKAALVSYYRDSAGFAAWSDFAVAGWFSAANQLSWQRNGTGGAVDGHYYVFEAMNNEFSVQALSFSIANNSPSATAAIAAVDTDKAFVIASHRTAFTGDDNEDGQIAVFLASPTSLAARRQFQTGGGNAISDIRAFVVQLAGPVRVQHGAIGYSEPTTQLSVAISPVNLAAAMVWNGVPLGPGALESEATAAIEADTGFQRLKFLNSTSIDGERGEGCGGTDCFGIGQFEVVDFSPTTGSQVKSGSYTGNGAAGRTIATGLQSDVVFVKRDDAVAAAVVRTATMPGDATKDLAATGVALFANGIQSLGVADFTLGTDARVNALGATYHWVAFRGATSDLKVGIYTGNNVDNRSIPVAFQPEYVITLPENAGVPLHRSSTMAGDTSYDFDVTELGPPANAIQAFEVNGFQIGTSASVNANAVTYHYIAWNAMPGQTAVGTYLGDGSDSRPLDVVGFMPEWILVKRQGDLSSWVHKPASTGVTTDYSLRFVATAGVVDAIQALRPLGFEVGTFNLVNAAGSTYHWVAFGPHPPVTTYRSIGTAPADGAGTVTVSNGSTLVTGAGTAWKTALHGRGDVITIPCSDPPTCTAGVHYTVASVASQDMLQLADPHAGAGAGLTYLIRRQFGTVAAWEDCVDGPLGQPCPYFPVASSSLVADNRNEVGIAYRDGPLAGGLVIDDATTDATHTIALTADPGNRHHGLAGTGVVIDNGASASPAVHVSDDFVTVEWMELKGGGPGADGFRVNGLSAGPGANQVVLRNNLVHNAGGHGLSLLDPDTILDASNNILYANAQRGAEIAPLPLSADSRIRLRNNTAFGNGAGGIAALDASNPTVTLQNNIAHSNTGGNLAVPALDTASRNNLASDASAIAHSPAGGGLNSVPLSGAGGVNFVSTAPGAENLHIQAGSAAENAGADLGAFLSEDIDDEPRSPLWEIGADDTGLFTGSCSLLTTTGGASTVTVETAEVRMVWDAGANGGGGLNQLYGKTEPNPAVNRSGDLVYNVFSTQLNDGAWFFEDQAGSVQPLEVTPTRVRLRQNYSYTANISLARDWTAYPFPRLAIDETLTLQANQDIRGAQGLHPKGELACGGANTFFCTGSSTESERVWIVSDDATTYSDMLAFPYTTPFFGRAAATPTWEANFETGAPNTFLSRVRDFTLLSVAAGSYRRSYLVYPYLAGIASTGTGFRPFTDDYRGPDVLTINAGKGGPWIDSAENTAASDFFNEAESAYLLDFNPALGLDFDIDGATTRRKPFFKARRWRSLQPPTSVTLEAAPLAAGADYRAAMKPVSRGHLCTPGCNQLALGGLVGASTELLNDPTPAKNAVLNLVGANFLYLGSDSRFGGLNVSLETPGTGTGTLQWQYWNGAAWANLEAVAGFTDGTNDLKGNGSISWTADPVGWTTTSVSGGPALYYVRAFVSVGAYTTLPREAMIRTDILLFQYCGNITASAQTFAFAPLATTDLSVLKTDGQTSAVPGDPVSYTITVSNNGPTAVTGATVMDTLPASLTSASWTCAASPGSGCAPTGLGNILDAVNLLAGGTATYTLTADIDPFARGTLANTVTVTPPAGVTDTNGANDFWSDSDTLDASADVGIVKSDDVDPAPLGGLVSYTLTVTNNGPSGATNVDVSDPLPASMDLDSGPGAITPSQGSCSYDAPSRTVGCTLGNLAPLGVATVTIKVRPGAVGSFDNTASMLHGEPDPASGNDSESETTQVAVSSLAVLFFTASSTNQRNVLEWLNPTDVSYASTEVVWRTDRFPTSPADGMGVLFNGGVSGGREKRAHDAPPLVNGQTYYYGAFVHRSLAPLLSPGRFVTGRPFDHTSGPVKWAFATGATALAAPTVGGAGVIATSNDHFLYAMERGIDDDQLGVDSGEWPTGFEPADVGGPVQLRSPVVPVSVAGANPVVYVGSQDGSIYTIDAAAGGSVPYLWVTPIGPMVQAAPAGIFGAFGGSLDYVLVGTRDGGGPNAFVALDPYTGVEIDRWDNGGAGPGAIGIVNGMAAVDYGPPAPPRVYFTNYERTPIGSTLTLRCFELSSTPPVFNQIWARALGNIDSSPVLRNGRVYVGSPTGGGTVYSIDALDGNNTLLDRSFVHGNGQVKGFVFPDRASNDVYFATDDFVWGVTDNAGGMVNKFAAGISLGAAVKPSPVLFVPGSHYVYVGGTDGKLYELDTLGAPGVKSVTLGNGLAAVGAPSLDRVYGLVHVGTVAGIFYAVQAPLP